MDVLSSIGSNSALSPVYKESSHYITKPKLAQNLAEALGQVPVLRIARMGEVCRRQDLYIKLEACNPGGSIKEKNAAYLVEAAELSGHLRPGGTIVESSSGNFGIGLAMMGAARGYRVIIVVDAKTSSVMRRILEVYGAELVDVSLSAADKHGSMQVARMKKASELTQQIPGAWYPCQHLNPLNPLAHFEYTAREIITAFDGPPDVVVIGISTAGQISGIGRFFREHYPHVTLVGVDVAGSAILGTPRHSYKMTGLGLSFVPPNFSSQNLDVAYSIPDQLAFSLSRKLAKQEGLLLGASTGAIMAAGLAYASTLEVKKQILMLNPDRGDRYLETVFDDGWIKSQKLKILEGKELDDAICQLSPVTRSLYEKEAKK